MLLFPSGKFAPESTRPSLDFLFYSQLWPEFWMMSNALQWPKRLKAVLLPRHTPQWWSYYYEDLHKPPWKNRCVRIHMPSYAGKGVTSLHLVTPRSSR